MIRIVILGGTGDVYLICALFDAFKRWHNRTDVEVVTKERYACIPEMFGVPYSVNDHQVVAAETNTNMQRDYDNVIANNRYFFAHPCFIRTPMRVDWITAHPDASQADMYKMILRVPPEEPLQRPNLPQRRHEPNTALIIPQATSWPGNQPDFWRKLAARLETNGWRVALNEPEWTLRELFQRCADAEWVIGCQCGVMSILVTGEFPCRKTFVTPNVDGNRAPGFVARETFPYGYVTKFSNRDYDVEEFKVSHDDHDYVADLVARGSNGLRLWPHNPNPIVTVSMPLAPGDFLDRYAVLVVKRERFDVPRRAAIEREYQRHAEAHRQMPRPAPIDGLFEQLLALHRETYDLLERLVPSALNGGGDPSEHVRAIALNKRRVELKREIDAHCSVQNGAVKSYYGG